MNDLYGVLCESDMGLDAFGNPLGKQILMESTGSLTKNKAIDKASQLQSSGRYGRVKLVKIEIVEGVIV